MKKKKLMKKQSCFVVLLTLLLLFPSGVFAQQQVIKGQVVDDKGETVIGATVMLKGTQEGSITDIDGNFSLKGQVGSVLTISYVGFSPLEVKVTKLEGNRFVLKEDAQVLDEVVVVGMDKQKRNTITAAVATVNEKAIVNRPVSDLTSALQGNVAGLNFASDATSSGVGGETGAEIKFNIRGIGSINGGDPYVLVDGVEQSMQNVNPADIASISVLKDASASAVYGARAAYGVVLVTTKSGKKEKTRVTYRGTVGFSSPINMPEMMNSLEFAHYVNERNDNMGVKHLFSDRLIEKMEGFMANPYSAEFPGVEPNQQGTGWAGSQDAVYANTDWFDYYFKKSAIRHSHNLNITGGSDKFNYYVGMGYTYQEGLLDKVEDNLSKYNVNTKFQITANEWLKFNFNNNMTLNIIKRPLANQTIFYGTIANSFPNRPTVLPVDSEYNLPDWNEFLRLKQSHYNQNRISDAMSFSAVITPLEGWEIVGEMKVRLDVEKNSFERGKPIYENPNGQFYTVTGSTQGYQYPGMHWKNSAWGSYTRGDAFNYYLSPNISSSYTHQWGDHFFKAMAGYQMELQENSNGYTYKDGMLSDDIFSFANANGTLYAGDNRTHWATMGTYARLNWNYQNVYFLEVSGRYDGSSRFAPGHRWGFFPSFSAGYDLARTDYFQKLKLPFSQLKVRVSYGRLGNQNGAGYYDYIGVMPLVAAEPNAWILPGVNVTPVKGTIAKTPKMVSPYITWEKVDNANLGLDLMLLDNRLSITADIYQRTTHDMIGPAEAIPSIGGIAASDRAKVNNATLRNRGWELSVNWHDQLKCGFSYGVGFNLFNYKAVVTKYNNPEGLIYNNHTGLDTNKGYYEGMDVGEIWGYQADDLFMSNREIDDYIRNVDLSFFKPNSQWQRGDLKYLDVNGDGKVDPGKGTLSDHGDLRVIGNATPKYSFGINLNLGYKGFEVSTLLQGVAKRDFPLAGSTYLFGGKNFFKEHLDYFNADHPNGYLPRLTEFNKPDYQANSAYNNSRYLVNAAYMRMKNLMVSYTFNKKMLRHIGIENLKVYFTCDNLFTITKLPKQFDPETLNQVNTWAGGSNESAPGLTSPAKENGNGKVYPMNRNFVFGLDFTF
ncbi:SusC/RagA family TonB-linked outer membrane protein [Bacteroides finegoldii]|jgi:tonB-linked outer membrane protein, susC/ragA family|uniref:SusC/RagA family TonB-linked outer membrane protein n=1 Tax=Bacteroides finegoldii TaxID=338188 RepID=UPI001EDB480F|nr:TonB-dependent receptor [Bacteroides finegoldii]MCG4683294.1 TonB-dependent receptor [Bacteroides finegoldii]